MPTLLVLKHRLAQRLALGRLGDARDVSHVVGPALGVVHHVNVVPVHDGRVPLLAPALLSLLLLDPDLVGLAGARQDKGHVGDAVGALVVELLAALARLLQREELVGVLPLELVALLELAHLLVEIAANVPHALGELDHGERLDVVLADLGGHELLAREGELLEDFGL